MPDQESVSFDLDPRSVLNAIKQMNSAMEGYEKNQAGANERMQKAIERTADLLLKVNDRSRNSLERLTQSIEKQAAAYGKTNAERMVAERDRIIKKLGDEQGMIERVNAAYAKMLADDGAGRGAASIQSLGTAAYQSKASLALMGEEIGVHIPRQLRTFITMLPGVGQMLDNSFKAVAVIALVVVLVEAVKKVIEFRQALEDMHTAAEKTAGEFSRFADSQKQANLQTQILNDQLENAIAKLQHKPVNNLKTAIDEAAEAAQVLSDKMDKSLRGFADLIKTHGPSTFAQIVGGQTGTGDIAELIQGKSGFGGLVGEMYKVTNAGGDPTSVLLRYRAEVQARVRQSQFAQAYQQRQGFEGFSAEEIRAGQHPPGVAMHELLADQGPRLETLNALIGEIDALAKAYQLEVTHAKLTKTQKELEDEQSKSGAFVISNAEMAKMQAGASSITGRPSLYPWSPALGNANALGWQAEVTVTQAEIDKANAPLEAARKAQMDARWKGEEDLIKKTDAERLSDIATEAKYTERVLELRKGPGGEIELARTVAQVREDALRKEFDLTGDAVKYREQSLANERDMRLKMAEIEIKQHDELAKTATGLWNTLFTKPQDFGKQLGTTIHGAVLKPVTEGLGNLTANMLGPTIFGEGGAGGLAGLFGNLFGKNDPIKTATDQNTLATRQNSQAIFLMSALLARQSGISLSSLPTPAMIPGSAALPKFAEGGVTRGPTIVGEAGPELVIPLGPRTAMNRPMIRSLGAGTSTSFMGVLAEIANEVAVPSTFALAGPAALAGSGDAIMALLTGAVGAITPAPAPGVLLGMIPTGRPGGGGRYSAPEEGHSIFNKGTYEDLRIVGSKGGRISGVRRAQAAADRAALRAIAVAMKAEERDALMAEKGLFSDAEYKGPKDWDKSTAHPSVSVKQLDERFPWLEGAFDKQAQAAKRAAAKEAEAAARIAEEQARAAAMEAAAARPPLPERAPPKRTMEQKIRDAERAKRNYYARKEASVRAPREAADLRVQPTVGNGYLRWFIDPRTSKVHIGPFVPEGLDDPAGFETHADWLDTIKYDRSAVRFDAIPKGYAQVHRGRVGILDNGSEPEMYLAPPLSNDQYSALTKALSKSLRLPVYDEGGTVASTGMAIVHQGEAIMPAADTMKRAIELNTAATERAAMAQKASIAQMAAMAANITGWLLAGIGAAVPRFGGGTSMGGNVLASGGGATWAPGGDLAAVVGGPGGTSGFDGPVDYGGGGGYAGGGGGSPGGGMDAIYNMPSAPHAALASILQQGIKAGGLFSASGFAGLKHAFNIGGRTPPPGFVGPIQGTTFKGVATSQAARGLEMAGGMMLAQQGLLGSSRGTWGGVAEGTLGGAAIGTSIAPGIGTAIGAAVGFGIGVGEMIAGVQSPENEAKKLVKQIYGISIDTSTAKQIAAIAKQSFGGNMGVAVRSDQVQKLVKLFAEAMGQKTSTLTALTPHAASLIQANGQLYQGAVYENGQPYTYAGGFRTYGGVHSDVLPTASPYAGNVSVTLNPQQTVDLWKSGTTQAMSGNPRLVSASAAAGDQMSASRAQSAISVLGPGTISA